jgi:hypothetical protein
MGRHNRKRTTPDEERKAMNDGKIGSDYKPDYIERFDNMCIDCEVVGFRTNRYLFRCPNCWRYW